MATCPNCGAKSREDPNQFEVTKGLLAADVDLFNADGPLMKITAQEVDRLACRCGWSIYGYSDDTTFIGWADTQRWPDGSGPPV